MTTPFDQKKAAVLLGHPGEAFEEITPYHLPEIYWVRIGSGSNVLGAPFIVRNGELISTKGYATASAWLRRAVMPLKDAPEADYVAQVLGGYDALPLGWSTAGVDGNDASTGERGGIRLHPFELKLVWPGYVHTRSRLHKAPFDGPPTPPFPPGGPGPTGGYAPPQACRAILKEVDGKLTWIVEQHQADGTWTLLLKEPIE
ncbi:MAG TPA: hypothetical protein VG222_10285 [Vicinamibacterales bacterium]|nr:hypothetical protein [Vicinamibacterales bacterium]